MVLQVQPVVIITVILIVKETKISMICAISSIWDLGSQTKPPCQGSYLKKLLSLSTWSIRMDIHPFWCNLGQDRGDLVIQKYTDRANCNVERAKQRWFLYPLCDIQDRMNHHPFFGFPAVENNWTCLPLELASCWWEAVRPNIEVAMDLSLALSRHAPNLISPYLAPFMVRARLDRMERAHK